MKVAAIIPARMASSRYLGKPLINIQGLPMIEHVRRRTLMCESFSDVVVATCDQEIRDVVEQYGGHVTMTSDRHVAASDRVAEAAESLDCTHVVNVQGDEILVLPEDLEQMITAIGTNIGEQFWNATGNIRTASDLGDESIVKCVVSRSGRILFCSRDFSHLPLNGHFEPLRMILGILGYTRDSLLNYNKLPRTPLEEMLSIDQSRIIENDIPLLAVSFSKGYIGINNRREETQVRGILAKDERQRSVLEDVLNF